MKHLGIAGFWSIRLQTVVAFAVVACANISYASVARAQQSLDRTSIIVAFVTDTAGHPIPGALLEVLTTSVSARTDNLGQAALLGVPLGEDSIRIRRLGFIEQRAGITVTQGVVAYGRYRLAPLVIALGDVRITSSKLKPARYANTRKFDDFYRRRSEGNGTFLTREDIDARHAQKPEDLIRMVSGVRIRYRGMVPSIQFLRCERVNVYIDGIRSNDAFRDYFALSPLDIEAIEVYHGIATVPPEFSPQPNDCAAIVVWTRWHGADE